MPRYLIILLTATMLLSGCITNAPSRQVTPGSYFWLPYLGISSDAALRSRVRMQTDAVLVRRGYIPGGEDIALALSTGPDLSDLSGDGAIGLGVYSGGYPVYPNNAATPPGMVMIVAYDGQTLQPLWRVTLPAPRSADDPIFRAEVDTALRTFPDRGSAEDGSGYGPILRTSLVGQSRS